MHTSVSTKTCKVSDLRYSGARQQLNSKPRPVEIPVRIERYQVSFNCAELSNAICALASQRIRKRARSEISMRGDANANRNVIAKP